MRDAEPRVTEAGRPVRVGSCLECSRRLIRHGGSVAPGARRLDVPKLPRLRRSARDGIARHGSAVTSAVAWRRAVDACEGRSTIPTKAEPASPRSRIPLTRIPGVGEKRAEALREAGIDSLERLAAAEPAALLSLPGVFGESSAAKLIAEARRLLVADEPA